MYPYEVTWTLNEDGNGKYTGNNTDFISFTYSLNDNQITIDFGEDDEQPGYKTSITSLFYF